LNRRLSTLQNFANIAKVGYNCVSFTNNILAEKEQDMEATYSSWGCYVIPGRFPFTNYCPSGKDDWSLIISRRVFDDKLSASFAATSPMDRLPEGQ
jgi:hypothetical protein